MSYHVYCHVIGDLAYPVLCEVLTCVGDYVREKTKEDTLTLTQYISNILIPQVEPFQPWQAHVDGLVRKENLNFLKTMIQVAANMPEDTNEVIKELSEWQGLINGDYNLSLPSREVLACSSTMVERFKEKKEVSKEVAAYLTYMATNQLAEALLNSNQSLMNYYMPKDPAYKKIVDYFVDDRRGHALQSINFAKNDCKVFISTLAAIVKWKTGISGNHFETELIDKLLATTLSMDTNESGLMASYDEISLNNISDEALERKMTAVGISKIESAGSDFYMVTEKTKVIEINGKRYKYTSSLIPFLAFLIRTQSDDAAVVTELKNLLKNSITLHTAFTPGRIGQLRSAYRRLGYLSDDAMLTVLSI